MRSAVCRVTLLDNLMDECFSCGSKTDPDLAFCTNCGVALGIPETATNVVPISGPTGVPKVELISRGWDVVDIDTADLPADPLEDDDLAAPLRLGTVEITVDNITVVEETGGEVTADPPAPTDSWDHLRPHGEMPPLRDRTTVPARASQIATLMVALSAIAAAGIRFYLNTLIEAFGKGEVSAQAVTDIEVVADMGLLVMAILAAVTAGTSTWWVTRAHETANFKPGPAGIVALISAVAGIAIVVTFFLIEVETVSEAIAANALIVLGLGLLMAACLATVRTIGRIDLEEHA